LQWVDEASAWLPYELITSCEHERAGSPDAYSGGSCFVGVDIGARKTVLLSGSVACWRRPFGQEGRCSSRDPFAETGPSA
jgi:hypothetical protein